MPVRQQLLVDEIGLALACSVGISDSTPKGRQLWEAVNELKRGRRAKVSHVKGNQSDGSAEQDQRYCSEDSLTGSYGGKSAAEGFGLNV